MRMSCAIMAHTSRIDALLDLCKSLPTFRIAIDSPGMALGETRNGDRAWAMREPTADWHVVLQDDALPIDGFTHHLAAALAHAPARTAVSLYVGTGRPRQLAVKRTTRSADRRGIAWLASRTLLWGVGVAMPTPMVDRFLEWGKGREDAPYDRRIGDFCRAEGSHVLYAWPSLVDHADGPSLVEHGWGPPRAPRRAVRTGVAPTWDTPVLAIR